MAAIAAWKLEGEMQAEEIDKQIDSTTVDPCRGSGFALCFEIPVPGAIYTSKANLWLRSVGTR